MQIKKNYQIANNNNKLSFNCKRKSLKLSDINVKKNNNYSNICKSILNRINNSRISNNQNLNNNMFSNSKIDSSWELNEYKTYQYDNLQ